ncbi:28495_t:CDS:1, partial [Racocetra persica]
TFELPVQICLFLVLLPLDRQRLEPYKDISRYVHATTPTYW